MLPWEYPNDLTKEDQEIFKTRVNSEAYWAYREFHFDAEDWTTICWSEGRSVEAV